MGSNVRIYGEFFDERMRLRAQREGISNLQRAVVKQSHYAVRGYVSPASTPDSLWYYRLRRDGKIERAGPITADAVLEFDGKLETNPYWAWIKETT